MTVVAKDEDDGAIELSTKGAVPGVAVPKWTRLPIRTRPHRNPLAENDDVHPRSPQHFAQLCESTYYPDMTAHPTVEFVDVGCAFGGMLIELAPLFPHSCMLGLEIRSKVVNYAKDRTMHLRTAHVAARDVVDKRKELPDEETTVQAQESSDDIARPNRDLAEYFHHYNNVWFEQLNVMKFGSNCFCRGQLSRLFFCYPDPHWKRKNVRRRIISPGLVHEYAYWLRAGGKLYTVSDVEELEAWMTDCLDACPLFRRATEEELSSELEQRVLQIIINASEDAQRTTRKGLRKHFAVHIRLSN